MSQTPRTDAHLEQFDGSGRYIDADGIGTGEWLTAVDAEFCYQLERELAALETRLRAAEEKRAAYWTVLELLCQRFPDRPIGDLPGSVDEQSAQLLAAQEELRNRITVSEYEHQSARIASLEAELVHWNILLDRRDDLLRNLIKTLEDIHDSHKRKGLPLSDTQFSTLNRARSELSHPRLAAQSAAKGKGEG